MSTDPTRLAFDATADAADESSRPSLADLISALVDGWSTREAVTQPQPVATLLPGGEVETRWFTRTRWHAVHHASLLDQLGGSAINATVLDGDEEVRAVPASKPPARLDALDALRLIGDESEWWCHRLHLDVLFPLRRRLVLLADATGRAGGITDHRERTLLKAAASWLTLAEVLTGWGSEPWQPNVLCPMEDCDTRGSLRVRLARKQAACLTCGQTWRDETFLELGAWVAYASAHLAGPRHLVPDDEPVGVALRPCADPRCVADREGLTARRRARRKRGALQHVGALTTA